MTTQTHPRDSLRNEVPPEAAAESLPEWAKKIEANLGEVPRTFGPAEQEQWRMRPPAWCGWGAKDDSVPYVLQWELLREGRLVFGHLVQNHSTAFEVGTGDAPGVALYSPDAAYVEDPSPLVALAKQLRGWKQAKEAPDARFTRIVNGLIHEVDPMVGLQVPPDAVEGRDVFLTSLIFVRKDLPDGFISMNTPLPMLLHATRPGVCRLVPSIYW